jgi:glycosyltransferase involved in cell wall biosynthesis
MAERLRIAHLTPVYPPYAAGSGVACHYQAAEQARRGHDVSVWTVEIPGEPPPTAADVRRLQALVQLGAAPLLPGLYRMPPVDVVHVHHPFIFGIEPALVAALRRPRTAVVVSYHNRLIGSGLRRALFFGYEETLGRLLARRADRLVVLSREHAETISYLRTARRRRPQRLTIVPNGVDAERFSPGAAPELRRALGIPGDAVVAVHVATLDRTHFLKRTDLALEAVVRADEPQLHLVVVGDGEWRERLERGEAARQLGERVHFIGHRDHETLPEALRAADFFLLSSDRDSFSLVLLEAFACGLPAATTDPAGVRAMVAGSEAAVFARAGDAEALATAVTDLVRAGEEERRRRGQAARSLCLERYSIEAVVDRFDAIYAEAVDARVPKAEVL